MSSFDGLLESDLAILPASAANLVRLLGAGPALELALNVGGMTVQFSSGRPYAAGLSVYDRLSDVIGEAAVNKIALHYAACELYIPLCVSALRVLRNRAVCRRYDAITANGESGRAAIRELVVEFRLSDKSIKNIINNTVLPVEKAEQLALF